MEGLDKDIVEGFCQESNALIAELEEVLERLEGSRGEFPAELLEEFSQKIDRIMGAAKTIGMSAPDHAGLQMIGKLSELCKALGYQASAKRVTALIPLFSAFWSETLEVIASLLEAIDDSEETRKIARAFPVVLQKRLEWLTQKVAQAPTPVQNATESASVDQQIRDLIKSLSG